MSPKLLSEAQHRADDASVVVDLDDAELRRFRFQDRQAGDGGDGPLLKMKVRHLADVHLVDVVGAEDQHGVGAVFLDEVDVLKHRIRRAPIPAFAHAHLRHLNPFPRNTGEVLRRYERVLVPEMNLGQLLKLVRAEFLVDAVGYNKVTGLPLRAAEVAEAIKVLVDA